MKAAIDAGKKNVPKQNSSQTHKQEMAMEAALHHRHLSIQTAARQKRSPKMKSLLRFLALCAAVSLCVCYDSHESTESAEDLFLPRNRANSFMPPRGNTIYNSPSRNRFNTFMRNRKPISEIRAETCEDYSPCRLYAFRFGFQQAYQRYFGSRTLSPQVYRPTGIRPY